VKTKVERNEILSSATCMQWLS